MSVKHEFKHRQGADGRWGPRCVRCGMAPSEAQRCRPWRRKAPKKPGLYLFYGHVEHDVVCRFALVEVRKGGVYATERLFVDPADLWGVWRLFDEKPPA